ncbi:zinc ribbon domain-containing protein [Streptomyces sp. NPDC048506]|uniref:zinc ribbon domain-containing protein n=1 Tax=Streptomyces sp. NPDC048506 TaxID=3155028 RepID=UPI003422F568
MSSFCPDCGSASPPEARFCMGCGRERRAAAPPAPDGPPAPGQPPAAPAAGPPVPGLPAAPAGPPPYPAPGRQPSALGALLTRTVKGDWPAALKVAAGPTLLLLVLASVAAMFGSDDAHSGGLGWGVRMRIALALLLQSVGGGVGISGSALGSRETFGMDLAGTAELSLVPLAVTVAWAGVLAFAARRFTALRPAGTAATGVAVTGMSPTGLAAAGVAGGGQVAGAPAGGRTAALEAALRIAAVCAAATFVLALLAQPSYAGVELSSAPFLALLWSFLLSAAVCAAALGRGEAGAWLAARPAWQTALSALRTALLALLVVVVLAGVVTVVALLATAKETPDGAGVVAMLVLLPNIGALALALAWGAPVNAEWNLPDVPFLDTAGRESVGYGALGHLAGGWALFGVIVGGLVCALLVGLLAVRRGADRREQLLAAGFFVLAMLLLVLVAGVSVKATFQGGDGDGGGYGYGGGFGGFGDGYGGGRIADAHGELAAGGAETLLFALLWTFGAVLVVPYLLRMVGRGGAPAAPIAPPTAPTAPTAQPPGFPAAAVAAAPAVPPAVAPPAVPTAAPSVPTTAPSVPPAVPDVTPVAPDTTPPAPVPPAPAAEEPPGTRRRAVTWVALALAAFLVGGGATAGALYLDGHKDRPAGAGDKHARSDRPARPSDSGAPTPDPSASPSSSASPSDASSSSPSPSASASAALPDGFVQKYDPYGFSLGVKSDWKRSVKGTQVDYTAPVGKQYLRIGVIANAPQASYDNFLSMEKGAAKRTNYQRAELRRNTFQNRPGARWEFTYVNDTGNTVHAVDQAYVAADGTEYSVYYECLDVLYDPENDKVFSTALSTWSVSDLDID